MTPRPRLLPLAALVALAAFPAAADGATRHSVRWISGAEHTRAAAAVFHLDRVRPNSIVRASLVQGRARKRVALKTVRAAARSGVLRVRRPRARAAKLRLVVDKKAPQTQITGLSVSGTTATASFTSSESGSTFSCRLDAGAWGSCSSPKQLTALAAGGHTLLVRATDRAGNTDSTAASTTWTTPAAAAPAPAPAPAPEPEPEPTAPSSPEATSPMLSDDVARNRVAPSPWEPRPTNTTANHRVPTDAELAGYRAQADNWGNCTSYHGKVTGRFTGTTDEILQWGAAKWGFDPELLRAVAVVESWWRQSEVGDNGQSFGLMQVKGTVHHGTFPLSRDSTAYNVDFYGAILRHYVDGCARWLNDVERGRDYVAGDVWGSVGAWYAGRWYTPMAETYIAKVKGAVLSRQWLSSTF